MEKKIYINNTVLYFFERTNFGEDENLIKEIEELITPYYEETTFLLKREIKRNKTIYYLKNDDGELVSFFMANFEMLEGQPTYYMGLTAIKESYKNLYYSEPLMAWHIKKVSNLEKQLNTKVLCWCHTAIVTSYRVIERYFENLIPNRYGTNMDSFSKSIAHSIVEKFNYKHDQSNPFILKGVAYGTRASENERKRIQSITERHNFRLFNNFNIEEYNGDRIILLSYIPETEKVEHLYRKYFND